MLTFLSSKEGYYNLVVSIFQTLVLGHASVEVLLTDEGDALRSPRTLAYSEFLQLLYFWHFNKNFLECVNTR